MDGLKIESDSLRRERDDIKAERDAYQKINVPPVATQSIAPTASANLTAEQKELAQLREENAQLKKESKRLQRENSTLLRALKGEPSDEKKNKQ